MAFPPHIQGSKDDINRLHVTGILSNTSLFGSNICLHKILQVGGLMGLCMGFSILSFVEIVYWVTYRLARNARN